MKFTLIVLSILTLTFTAVTCDTWAVNQALDLDGSRDYVEIPHPDPDIPEPGEESTRIRHDEEDDEDEDEDL